MSTVQTAAYARALGARLLGEANDLKRTPESLADELGVSRALVQAAIEGTLDAAEYRPLFERVAAHYPIGLGRLWIEPSDAEGGVRHMTAAASAASSRVFTRKNRTGALTPYYEYRDTAMSRVAPFRPEWIRELREVTDADPDNPDVAYNRGHFLHQTTFFVGPVNFYWEVNGKRHCAELETGDSNYITPFWPHSFTSRDPKQTALIIAVTYGGEVARARDEAGRIGVDRLKALAFDLRDANRASSQLLRRHLQVESLPEAEFADRAVERGLPLADVAAWLEGTARPDAAAIAILADIVHASPRDLMPPTRRPDDEVVVRRRREADVSLWPGSAGASYRLERMARSRCQPYLKSFILTVLPGSAGAVIEAPLHQYLYNHGDREVRLVTDSGDDRRELVLAPGDSAYVAPMVCCRFLDHNAQGGELFVVRVPGDLHADAVFELSGMAPSGWARVAAESTRWF
jgi:hypothetical protein